MATIGSAVNFANIPIFVRSDLAFALQMRPISHCLRCLGRTDSKNVAATAYESFGMQLIALPCDFLFSANLNIYCLYSLLRKARVLTQAAKRAITFFFMALLCLWVPATLDLILGLPPSLPAFGYLYILFLYLPWLALSFLCVRDNNKIMGMRVSPLKISPYLKTERKFICFSICKLVLTTTFLFLINCASLVSNLSALKQSRPDLYFKLFHESSSFSAFFTEVLFGGLVKALHTNPEIASYFARGTGVRLGAWLLILGVLSAGFRDSHSSSFRRPGCNLSLLFTILLHVILGIVFMLAL